MALAIGRETYKEKCTPLVDHYVPHTIAKYGRRLGPLFYTLIHAGELSSFSDLEYPVQSEIHILRESDDSEKWLTFLGPLFSDLITKNAPWQYTSRWICMSVLDFEAWCDKSKPCPR